MRNILNIVRYLSSTNLLFEEAKEQLHIRGILHYDSYAKKWYIWNRLNWLEYMTEFMLGTTEVEGRPAWNFDDTRELSSQQLKMEFMNAYVDFLKIKHLA